MNHEMKRAVVATLLKAGRRDLAETFAAGTLNKLPADTKLVPQGNFSVWDGKLAAVFQPLFSMYDPHDDFDPSEMARQYRVFFVKDSKGKPLLARDYDDLVGKSYHDEGRNRFSVQGPHGAKKIGEFLPGEVIWVGVESKELNPGEVRSLAKYLKNNGWIDVSETKLAKNDWGKVWPAKSWDDLSLTVDKANALYEFAERRMGGSDDAVLEKFKAGVYALSANEEKFKYIVKGPSSRVVPKRP